MTIFVHKDAFEEKEQKILAGIHKAVNPDHIELESDLALIAIVGRGMKFHDEVLPEGSSLHWHMPISMSR